MPTRDPQEVLADAVFLLRHISFTAPTGFNQTVTMVADQTEALAATLPQPSEDTRRLDWMDSESKDAPRLSQVVNIWWRGDDTVRQAIDAAEALEKEQGE